jgi:hypothetical protein
LVRDDAVDTPAVKGNGTIELREKFSLGLGDMRSADTTTLLALREDVVGMNTSVQQVHEHRNTSAIVRTKGSTVSVPVGVGLPDLVGACLAVHSVNVRHEQRAVILGHACVNVQIASRITVCACMSRGTLLQPVSQALGSLAVVWTHH